MKPTSLLVLGAILAMAAAPVLAEGIAAHVATIDHEKQCMTVEWDNDTEKPVCWTKATKFSVLETRKPAKATDVRKGSYLRMEGEHKDGTYWATEIVIWEQQAKE